VAPNQVELLQSDFFASILGDQRMVLFPIQRSASAILVRTSAIPQYCGRPKQLRTKKRCRTAVADLQNLISSIPQLSAVFGQFKYFLVPFPQLRMFLKIDQKYF
jgi:hypothetical protein